MESVQRQSCQNSQYVVFINVYTQSYPVNFCWVALIKSIIYAPSFIVSGNTFCFWIYDHFVNIFPFQNLSKDDAELKILFSVADTSPALINLLPARTTQSPSLTKPCLCLVATIILPDNIFPNKLSPFIPQ